MNDVITIGSLAFAVLTNIPQINKFVRYIYRLIKKNEICGKWNFYFWINNDGNIKLEEKQVIIKRGFRKEYNIESIGGIDAGKDNYKGYAFIENQQLCVSWKINSAVFKETVVHRYFLATIDENSKLYGFWLSYDYGMRVSCGGSILSRKKINAENEVNKFIVTENKPFMSINTL